MPSVRLPGGRADEIHALQTSLRVMRLRHPLLRRRRQRARAGAAAAAPLLTLKAGDRGLRVFDDGTAVESRRGGTTLRRPPERRMRRLRELIARRPCVEEWRRWASPPRVPGPEEFKPLPPGTKIELSTAFGECVMIVPGFGGGLSEIWVTIRAPDDRAGPFPVYVVCDGAKESYKQFARRHYQEYLKPNWLRFLADVSRAARAKSILKGCEGWR